MLDPQKKKEYASKFKESAMLHPILIRSMKELDKTDCATFINCHQDIYK